MTPITLTINGMQVTASVEPRTHLADFLREQRGLTGTHLGCEHGICGACTLLLDDVPVRSCITYAVACDGATVTTIEGLDDDEVAAELRAAFSREHALQCGYCTPGMLMSGRDVVLRAEHADERQIRVAMSGNLCRCTGYVGIIRAVSGVIKDRRARGIAAIPDAGRKAVGPAGSGHAAAAGAANLHSGMIAARKATTATNEPVAASAGAASAFTPLVSLTQSIVVHHPRGEVWRFFGRPADVAACLPGASVSGGDDANVTGRMRVKVGPIAAEFEGVAVIVRDPATFSGTIRGSGRDTRSSSATQGEIRYRLVEEGAGATRVELTVGYTLTGPLAQFNRSALVQDIAGRLTKMFAANLETRLAAPDGRAPPAAALNAGTLMISVVGQRIKLWLRTLLGGRNA